MDRKKLASAAGGVKIERPPWVVFALISQLVLVFFFPPIELGNRSIFLSDIWCVLWVMAGFLTDPDFRASSRVLSEARWQRLKKSLMLSGALIGVTYMHGAIRPSLTEAFSRNFLFYMKESDLFQPGRELVVAVRFLSWIWGGILVSKWFSSADKNSRKYLAQALLVCSLAAALIMILEVTSGPFSQKLGILYGFDPDFEYWRGRAYGPFRSPVEANIALGLSGFLILASREVTSKIRGVGALFCMIGLLLTKTLTGIVAAPVALILTFFGRVRRNFNRLPIWKRVVGAALLVLFGSFLFQNEYAQSRVHDFLFRMGAWKIYLSAMAIRLDLLVFGVGFAPYHTDSGYLFIFSRAGTLGLAAFSFWLSRTLKMNWSGWARIERATVLFILVSALMFDTFIYRHAVSIFLAAGIPLLSRSNRDSDRRAI